VRILTFSSLFPNSIQPDHGVFVEQRLRQLVATGEVAAEVVAPVPWFPFTAARFGRYARLAAVPAYEDRGGLRVSHPRYPLIPKVGMSLAPSLMAAALRGHLRRILASAPFDLIDAHYLYPDGVAAAMLGRWLDKPVVLTARGSDVNVIANFPRPRARMLWAMGRAARVITVSRALKQKLEAIGTPAETIEVLPNGVDLDLFRPLAGRDSRENGPRRLLIVGHLKEGKGHSAAIEALKSLEHCVLVIVGDGPLRGILVDQAKKARVDHRVEFVGRVPHARLPERYNDADALVLLSEREGMPNVVLESLACGTPVIATRVGGVPEILTDPVAGVLLEEATPRALCAAVLRLSESRPDRRSVRAFAMRFSWDATTRGQIEIFKAVGAQRRRTSSPMA
jgi:teichuronic acid biosynthesis glycosyltransferase TuaC